MIILDLSEVFHEAKNICDRAALMPVIDFCIVF